MGNEISEHSLNYLGNYCVVSSNFFDIIATYGLLISHQFMCRYMHGLVVTLPNLVIYMLLHLQDQ